MLKGFHGVAESAPSWVASLWPCTVALMVVLILATANVAPPHGPA